MKDIQLRYNAITENGDEQLAIIFDLGIYTDARIGERAKLTVGYVSQKKLKLVDARSAAGNRTVPTHPALRPTIDALLTDDKAVMAQ